MQEVTEESGHSLHASFHYRGMRLCQAQALGCTSSSNMSCIRSVAQIAALLHE